VFYFDYDTPDDNFQRLRLKDTNFVFGTNGVKYSKHNGNMISFLKYEEPQSIATDDIITVEYAYKYGV